MGSPYLNRFVQPDTIVPGMFNPQNLNRFSYVRNNPILYTDPSGHAICLDGEQCGKPLSIEAQLWTKYSVKLVGQWSSKHKAAVLLAVQKVGDKFAESSEGSSGDAFKEVYGHIKLKWEGSSGMCGDDSVSSSGCTDGAHQIRFWSMSGHGQNDIDRMVKNVVHELGHAYDWTHYDPITKTRASNHMPGGLTRDNVLRPNMADGKVVPKYWDWQQSGTNTPNEIFADMFLAWVYNAWNTDTNPLVVDAVSDANNWMNSLAAP